jgi:hypothetical protein
LGISWCSSMDCIIPGSGLSLCRFVAGGRLIQI